MYIQLKNKSSYNNSYNFDFKFQFSILQLQRFFILNAKQFQNTADKYSESVFVWLSNEITLNIDSVNDVSGGHTINNVKFNGRKMH